MFDLGTENYPFLFKERQSAHILPQASHGMTCQLGLSTTCQLLVNYLSTRCLPLVRRTCPASVSSCCLEWLQHCLALRSGCVWCVPWAQVPINKHETPATTRGTVAAMAQPALVRQLLNGTDMREVFFSLSPTLPARALWLPGQALTQSGFCPPPQSGGLSLCTAFDTSPSCSRWPCSQRQRGDS